MAASASRRTASFCTRFVKPPEGAGTACPAAAAGAGEEDGEEEEGEEGEVEDSLAFGVVFGVVLDAGAATGFDGSSFKFADID